MNRMRQASLVFVHGLIELIVYLPLVLIADALARPTDWERLWWLVPLLGYPAGYLLGRRAAFRQPSVTLLLACVCGLGIGALLLSAGSPGTSIAVALGGTVGLYRGARAALAPWPNRFTAAHFSIGLLIYVLYSFIFQRYERFAVPSFVLLAGGLASMAIMLLAVNVRTVRSESTAPGSTARADVSVRSRNTRLTLLVFLVTLLIAGSGSLQRVFSSLWSRTADWISGLLTPKGNSATQVPQEDPAPPLSPQLPAGEPSDPSPWWDWVMYGFVGIVGLFIVLAVIRRLPLVPSLLRQLAARISAWLRRERPADNGDYRDEVDRIAKPERKMRSRFGFRRRHDRIPDTGDHAARLIFLYRTWLSDRKQSFEPSRTPIEIGQAEARRSGEDGDRRNGMRLTEVYSAYRYGGIEAKNEELDQLSAEIRRQQPKK